MTVGAALITPIPFDHNGHRYEVRCMGVNGVWTIRLFKDGVDTGLVQEIGFETAMDYRTQHGGNLVREQMEAVRSMVLKS